jgi:hypothetical protein
MVFSPFNPKAGVCWSIPVTADVCGSASTDLRFFLLFLSQSSFSEKNQQS